MECLPQRLLPLDAAPDRLRNRSVDRIGPAPSDTRSPRSGSRCSRFRGGLADFKSQVRACEKPINKKAAERTSAAQKRYAQPVAAWARPWPPISKKSLTKAPVAIMMQAMKIASIRPSSDID